MTRALNQANSVLSGGNTSSHIIPGILYPAVAGKLLDGSTSHSGNYGTAQDQSGGDGRMYYYTDIKGSKPIRDPRIGAHFGSQRHKFKSLQFLEQETATHGTNVYSVDGREWMRAIGDVNMNNAGSGVFLVLSASGEEIEITGYFNDANIILESHHNQDNFTLSLNGTTLTANDLSLSEPTPLGDRYVDSGSVANISFSTTPILGINTIKIGYSNWLGLFGIELIAQDTTSTATKSQIQIPAQNVVVRGRSTANEFAIAATAHHYNPFAFKTDGTTAWASGAHNGTAWPVGTGSSANIDTATSLGLDAWVSTNYYKPYNGGRVVKWVASDGTIKTSVNMMPPNARSIANSASLTNGTEKGDDSAGTSSAAVANDTFYPTFTDIAIDHSQAEVAKTFHYREFGNGAANAGTGSSTYPDASMLYTTADDIAYVMDDGLTSLSGVDVTAGNTNEYMGIGNTNGDAAYVTFIGTGITYQGGHSGDPGPFNVAMNLPYGTHVLKIVRQTGTTDTGTITIDGVLIWDEPSGRYGMRYPQEITFYQPKRPPIPEEAVVLADYMLMADFVAVGATGLEKISKGVRLNSCSRDFFADTSNSTLTFALDVGGTRSFTTGFKLYTGSSNANAMTAKLHSFGTNFVVRGYNIQQRSDLYVGSTDSAQTDADGDGSYGYLNSAVTLGLNDFLHKNNASQNGVFGHYEIVSPIHTSSHYQSFETPFLHELVGGDRNMEQTNLVVTPDGKTWDEVTRDVSYIGNVVVSATGGSTETGSSGLLILDEWRGDVSGDRVYDLYTKDWAIAYNRLICLKDGFYQIRINSQSSSSTSNEGYLKRHRGQSATYIFNFRYSADSPIKNTVSFYFQRGDAVSYEGAWHSNVHYSKYEIMRV